MARQRISLGEARISAGTISWSGSVALDEELVAEGAATNLVFFSFSQNFLQLRTDGPDLNDAWETRDGAVALVNASDESVSMPGPNFPGSLITDATEPYNWYPATNFTSAVNGLGSGEIKLVLDDGRTPVPDGSLGFVGDREVLRSYVADRIVDASYVGENEIYRREP